MGKIQFTYRHSVYDEVESLVGDIGGVMADLDLYQTARDSALAKGYRCDVGLQNHTHFSSVHVAISGPNNSLDEGVKAFLAIAGKPTCCSEKVDRLSRKVEAERRRLK